MPDIAASEDFVARYLARIGWNQPAPTTLDRDVIVALAEAHAAQVPFENLRLHPEGAILLDEDVIIRRILDDDDGGLCYELNSAFARLLERLGATVEYVGASVEIPVEGGPPRIGFPLSHMALRVTIGTGPIHVDVGFGGPSIVRDAVTDGERVTAGDGRTYIVETAARQLLDFTDAAHWHSSSPESRFQQSVVCSVVRDGMAITVFGRRGDQPGAEPRWGFSEAGIVRDVTSTEAAELLNDRFGITRALPTAVRLHAE